MGLTLEELTYIINHVFLPLKLPHKYDPGSPSKDVSLLRYTAQVAESFRDTLKISTNEAKGSAIRRWDSLIRMLHDVAFLHVQHFLTKEEVEVALEQMQLDDVLPLYIEPQNAAVIFRKIREDRLTFEYFEVSLPAEVVMQECNKIVVQYPANSRLLMTTADDVLSTVANVLSYFSSNAMDDAIPKTKKGGFRHDETRDTASPRYISEALAGIIRGTQPSNPRDIPTKFITKRLDDHVLWKSAEKPWRRSPMWLIIRVCLQTTLAEWGLEDGSGYKAFQAFLMASILKDAVTLYPASFTSDLLYFANAKLARRLFKMGECVNDARIKTLQKALQTVQEVSGVLKQRWNVITRQWETRVQWVAPDPKVFKGCTNLSFLNSRNYLLQVMDRRKTLSEGKSTFDAEEMEQELRSTSAPRRFSDPYQLPSKIPREELDMALFDFEKWIEVYLPSWVDSHSRSEDDCLPLSKLIFHYRNTASSHYKGNPEALSVMHLCILELWVALDKLVVRWCGLLWEYSPEIPEDILDPLLLPYFNQMRRLHQVQEYLKDRHKQAAKSGNKSVFTTHQSFANRFFTLPLAAPLRTLKARVEAWATERRTRKKEELEALNSEYRELTQEARTLACDHEVVENRNRGKAGRRRYRCERCRLYATAKKLRITPIEEPLPKNPEQARAIIFELNCPKPFAIWRDTVVSLLEYGTTNQEAIQELHPLSKYDPLQEFFEEAYPGQRVRMASSAKSVSASHYGNPVPLPKSHTQVILNCAGKFSLFLSGSGQNRWIKKLSHPDFAKECTLQVEGSYQSLQKYLDATSHSPNQVIASQHLCPTELSIDEYIAFGHIRAGNRLQWRNILRALRSQHLSFSEASVYFLILQAIWQAGQMGYEGLYREAHSDLSDEIFCAQALRDLETAIGLAGDNWTHTLLLAVIIALTLRIHNFVQHEHLKLHAINILSQARRTAFEWISTLQALVANQRQKQPQLRHALLGASLVLRATFDLESRNIIPFNNGDSVARYIFAGTFISNSAPDSLPAGICFLARRDRRVSLRLQSHISRLCAADPTVLHTAILFRWNTFDMEGSGWRHLAAPAEQWWSFTTPESSERMERVIHLNILGGSFLIDGASFDHLPNEITQHPTYKELFHHNDIENVCPSTIKGMSYEGYYQGHQVHFSLQGKELIVRRYEQGYIEEFIPSPILKGDLPCTLVDGNHHWYMEGSNSFQIRSQDQTWFKNEPRVWTATLRKRGQTLSGDVTRNITSTVYYLVDPHSPLYGHLLTRLQSLETQRDGILVTVKGYDPANGTIVYLPRHDLTFRITSSMNLECQSFPGFMLSSNYDGIGCLIGLQSMISLKTEDSLLPQRKIIVPKGELSPMVGPYGHPLTIIKLQDTGGYFTYDVDNVLGRLHGSRSFESDLFLILLHAFTSSSLPDKLTQRPGTEEALDYLRGSSCFSSYTISNEARSYLDLLATLTPRREFYPHHLRVMETTQWHSVLPTLSQNPNFLPMVEAILEHWRKLDQFYGIGQRLSTISLSSGMNHLSARANVRNWIFHPSTYSITTPGDVAYKHRDCIHEQESRERECLSFQVAALSSSSTTKFPCILSLSDTVQSWGYVEGPKDWLCDDIAQWMSTEIVIPELWSTLYELSRETG
ncbi:hypothetical protein CPB86DRAFT_818034 [Serendipita vermifera]|nr:hypothetical protein CPB86DRAFT_818034 [Serendipita vermifera]